MIVTVNAYNATFQRLHVMESGSVSVIFDVERGSSSMIFDLDELDTFIFDITAARDNLRDMGVIG